MPERKALLENIEKIQEIMNRSKAMLNNLRIKKYGLEPLEELEKYITLVEEL